MKMACLGYFVRSFVNIKRKILRFGLAEWRIGLLSCDSELVFNL